MSEIKKYVKKTRKFFKNNKTQNIIAISLILFSLILGTVIRLEVLPNLVDETTGDYTPLALDPYYFLRISETMLNGGLPAVDSMRDPMVPTPWSSEILPSTTVWIYKIMHAFEPSVTLRFANVLNPTIFFFLGLIAFGFLIWILTKNKWVTSISIFLLSIVPPYLYRTMAGFSDHDSIGMFGFFLGLLFFYLGIFVLEKNKKHYLKSGLYGLLAGFFTMFAIASWGGIAKFLTMILPLSFLLTWLIKKDKLKIQYLIFYSAWIFSLILSAIPLNFSPIYIVKSYLLSFVGLLSIFVLLFICFEILFSYLPLLKNKFSKYHILFSFGSVIIFGGIFYSLFIGNFFSLVGEILHRILYPFGTERVGLTVAENAQPYLKDLISQIGNTLFYSFLLGCFIVGTKIASGIKKKKLRPLFSISSILFVIGILFSRYSSSVLLNGNNFISKAVFFLSFLFFAISSVYIYVKSDWKIDAKWILIFSWMVPMLLAVRSANRVFFAIVPFISFMGIFGIIELIKWSKKNKDELLKFLGISLSLFLIVSLIFVSVAYTKSISTQAKYQTPSYNSDWQKAMSWVRNNTNEKDVFLHWWDYGYWVQTGGERPTFSDGGHAAKSFGDHLVARYVLTTPYPETAKSFMKTNNISYFLLDPTDVGKYSAYSSIADDEEISDRASWLPTFVSDPESIQETRNETIRIYQGGTYIDSDLIYEKEGEKIFLPKGKAVIGAIIISKTPNTYSQPIGVYVYNNKRYDFPLRYLFINGKLVDFKKGINATAYVYPTVDKTNLQFDLDGAAMYLSEKTMNSLFVQVYLMDDPNNLYPELELVHSQGNYPFPFYYGSFQGQIKIYEVHKEEMENILSKEEFLKRNGTYGEFDDLIFVE